METIIGLGRAGCNIARAFGKYPQYRTFTIDCEADADFLIPKQSTPEEYELACPSIDVICQQVPQGSGVLFAVCGAGSISGATLQLLEQLKDREISILYLKPDLQFLNPTGRQQERSVYNILQQYARSGVFKQMYIVRNTKAESLLGDVPVIGYFDRLNEAIVSTLHMINVFSRTEPVSSTISQPSLISRLVSYGIADLEKKEEKMFFSLDNVREKVYYYGINENQLREDGTLFKKITEQVKDASDEGQIQTSYGIFSTQYAEPYVYCIAYSSEIQS